MTIPSVKTILYATSLSNHTRGVFQHAIDLANVYQAKLIMLHVLKPLSDSNIMAIQSYLSEKDIQKIQNVANQETKNTMKQRLADFYQDEMAGKNLPEIEQIVVKGFSRYAIVEQANKLNADIIVMGSHNKFGRSSATTRKVIKHSGRAVFVVPTDG
ncbi:universal stress protein [Vibrio sp. 1-Bac 57]